ncbi:MAG: sulfite exporter TauE/SafE family protein [Ignavibacteriaceae bacterium]|nr:sulfite exporter TauE/SafE family protein [Ignavibacteriaceae bacterium]
MDYYLFKIIVLFFTGIFMGLLNVMSGGASLLTLPLLIFFGLDSSVANATNRVSIVVQNLTGVISFTKEKITDFRSAWLLALLTVPGSVLGAALSLKVTNEAFQKVLGVMNIIFVILLMIPVKRRERKDEKLSKWVYPAMTAIGFYGGFIQAGAGIFIMATLKLFSAWDLVKINAQKVVIATVFTIPAFTVFLLSGKIIWDLGISLALGSIIGAWLATQLSIKKGEKAVKVMLIITILVITVWLFDII